MKHLMLLCLFFYFEKGKCQSYETKSVIEKAEFYLKEAVGDSLFQYFKLDPDSFYKYRNKCGKTNYENINKGKKTKGNFLEGENIRFELKHPELQFTGVIIKVYTELDAGLYLSKKIVLDKIPDFLLENKPSYWLKEAQIDSLTNTLNLKKSVKIWTKQMEYNDKTRKYNWVVHNTLYEEKCFSDVEFLYINPVTGEILKRDETRLHRMHCF